MELTEQERLMLVGKKDEIRKLSEEILELSSDSKRNELELKKKVTGILSLISTIASYSKCSNDDLDHMLFTANTLVLIHNPLSFLYEIFCNNVNSIRFDFTKKDFKIVIPKIDVSLFKIK